MADERERLYIDTEKFTANDAGPEAVGLAMDLITRVWFPAKTAFVFDEDALAARLQAELPARGYTADMLRRNRGRFLRLNRPSLAPLCRRHDGVGRQSDLCRRLSVHYRSHDLGRIGHRRPDRDIAHARAGFLASRAIDAPPRKAGKTLTGKRRCGRAPRTASASSSGSGATVPQALQGDRVGREELAAAKLRFVDFTVTLRRRVWLCGHLRRDIWVPLR